MVTQKIINAITRRKILRTSRIFAVVKEIGVLVPIPMILEYVIILKTAITPAKAEAAKTRPLNNRDPSLESGILGVSY
jgi:hypothetical protein